jgi:hypothetical protein
MVRSNRSAVPPTIDDKSLEPHEGTQLDDQGHLGERAWDENGHAVDVFLPVPVRIVRYAQPDGRFRLIGDAAIPHDDIFEEYRSTILECKRSGFRA